MIYEEKLPKDYTLLTYIVNGVNEKKTKTYLKLINELLTNIKGLIGKPLDVDIVLDMSINRVLKGSNYTLNLKNTQLKEYLNELISSSSEGLDNKSDGIEQLSVFFNTKFNNSLTKTPSELNFFIELYGIFNQTIII